MMQITITLNGTKISPEIEPDTLLIDLVRSQGCYVSSAAARRQTADSVPYFWMKNQCFPVPCWRRGRTVTV